MLKIAVVEDEDVYRDQLLEYLERYGEERQIPLDVSHFGDGEDITEDYRADFDIIFLDIRMRFMNGMDAAKRIREKDSRVVLIFITNEAGFAIKGYEVQALDYVMKPVSYETFSAKMDRARMHIEEDTVVYITFKEGSSTKRVDAREILYIESTGHQMRVRLKDGEIVTYSKMNELEDQLSGSGFFRCNKGFLVNMYEVDGMRDSDCLIGGEKIPVSRRRRTEFMDCLTELL